MRCYVRLDVGTYLTYTNPLGRAGKYADVVKLTS